MIEPIGGSGDPRPAPGRLQRLTAALPLLGAALLVSVGVPLTSSAFSSGVTGPGTAAAAGSFTCAAQAASPPRHAHAYFAYAFDEPSGSTTAADSGTEGNTGAYQGSMTKDTAAPTACPDDPGGAYALDGSTSRVTTAKQLDPITSGFSEEVWFKTSSPGKLLGFESTQADTSDHYDKHLYIDTSGDLVYGIWAGYAQTLTTSAAVTDGAWHLVVATTSSTGSTLYLDGAAVASSSAMTTAEGFGGWWRIGEGRIAGWPGAPSSTWFSGSLRFAAVWSVVLTPDQVAADERVGAPPAASSSPAADATATATAGPTATAAPDSPAPVTATAQPGRTLAPSSATTATAAPGPVQPSDEPETADEATDPDSEGSP